LEVEQRE